ncbi:MAG: SDR family NAD(P)-dependent oxidoreductase [Robiginitomaculum sp.]|nr:SDR family NAD(P)-dependent oxidoreductase [Robiginitomaculum sp.]
MSPINHDPEHASLADWRAVHAVNTDGTFLGCRYGIAAMRGRPSGSIINISSRSGMVGILAAAACLRPPKRRSAITPKPWHLLRAKRSQHSL